MNAEQLLTFKLFSDLSPTHLDAVAEQCQLVEFLDKDVIFKHGEAAISIYGVLEGEVALSLVFEDKVLKTDIDYEESLQKRVEVFEKPIVVEVVHSGEIFGWSSLVSPHISTATATCRGPVKLMAISGEAMRKLFTQDAVLGFSVMNRLSELISQRLRNRTDKLIETWGLSFGTDQL